MSWKDLAPNSGNVDETSVLHEINDRSYTGETHHSEYFLCTLLAVGAAHRKRLIKNGAELYDKTNQPYSEAWNDLSRKEKEKFIDEFFLSEDGVDCYPSRSYYTMDLLDSAGVKYFHREFSEDMKQDEHSIICFPNDGKRISAKDCKIISKQLDNIESWVNGGCVSIETPFSQAPEVFLDHHGYCESNEEIKKIEKKIEKKLSNNKGTHWVKVPAAKANYDGTVTFNASEVITIYAKNKKEAEQIASFWSEWGNAKIEKRSNQKSHENE